MPIPAFCAGPKPSFPSASRAGAAALAALLCLIALMLLEAVSMPTPAGAQAARAAPVSQAFWDAIRLDDVGAMQTEMLRGAGANSLHPEHGPAIVVAARERSAKALAYLAKLSGTRIDATNSREETALMLVALHGDLESARLLLQRGAEVNRPGWTPLHYAAAGGQVPMIELLLEAHAYVDAQSPNRTTPLMMAARQKHTNAVRKLVEAGADPTPRNDAGYGAAEYMEAHGEKAEAQWLRERAAEFERRYGTVEKPRPARPEPATIDRGAAPAAASGKPAAPPAAISAPPPGPARIRLPGVRD